MQLAQPLAHVRLRARATIQDSTQLSLQFWARGVTTMAQCRSSSDGTALGWACASTICISLRLSSAPDATARFVPLCTFGGPAATSQQSWRKFVVLTSAFASGHGGFDEVVLLAGAASEGKALEVLLDDVVLVRAGKPPVVAAAQPAPDRPPTFTPGWCEYMAPWDGGFASRPSSSPGARSASNRPICRVANGDHLRGRWVQNCHPDDIRRPDRYAYGLSLPRTHGLWDYRVCFRQSYAERVRSRRALSWTWQPESCTLPKVDGARFSRWLGPRVLLFWGDSLSTQHFYALVLLLGSSVVSLQDREMAAAEEMAAASPPQQQDQQDQQAHHHHQQQQQQPQRQPQQPQQQQAPQHAPHEGHACDYEGLGNEGGSLTEARLQHGGRIIKVLGHVEMAAQLQDMGRAWWLPVWKVADVIVFNPVGHHLRTLPQAFRAGWYRRFVVAVLPQLAKHTKPTARLILRTSNVGHHGCEKATEPLASRADAWRALGGWQWRPAAQTPAYFGAPRDGPDKYDWRAPALQEHLWARLAASSPLGGRLEVLNVSHVDLRSDGHVAAAMADHWDPQKARLAAKDCLHYCFPGPADAWAVALYTLLVHRARSRSAHSGAARTHAREARGSSVGRRLQLGPVELTGGSAAVESTGGSNDVESTGGSTAVHADSLAPCERLIACERAWLVWKGRLESAADDGQRTPAPCMQADAPEASACTRALRSSRRREGLLVFTHLPKAGGSSFGELLARAAK